VFVPGTPPAASLGLLILGFFQGSHDIIRVGETLEAFDLHWEEADTPLTKNGLRRLILAGVRVQRYELVTAQATLAFYSLVRLGLCRNGSDGHQLAMWHIIRPGEYLWADFFGSVQSVSGYSGLRVIAARLSGSTH